MGSRSFNGATNYIASSATGYASTGTAFTIAAICTIAAHKDYNSQVNIANSASNLRCIALQTDASGRIALSVGAPFVTSALSMAGDGRWLLIAASKAAGTVAPLYYVHDFRAGTATTETSASTIADRTAGACYAGVGVFYDGAAAGDYHNGRIAAAGIWNYAMGLAEMAELRFGRLAWFAKFGRAIAGGSDAREFFADLTIQQAPLSDHRNKTIALSVGTQPAFDALSTPPGW